MKLQASRILKSLLFSLFLIGGLHSQDYKLLESDENHLKLEFNFSNKFVVSDILIDGIKFTTIKDEKYPLQKPGDPFLPTRSYEIGLPQNTEAVLNILEADYEILSDKFVISTPDSMNQPFNQLNYNQDVYGTNSLFPIEQAQINSEAVFRYIKIASLSIAPFQFNPVQRTLILNKKLIVRVDFKQKQLFTDLITPISDKMTEELIKTNLINSVEALTFLGKIESISDAPQGAYWYDPNKDYYKIYLKEKGVYRITYDQLINTGISPSSGIQDGQLEIFNNGVSLPIDIVDVQPDGLFNSGDYFQFIGSPAAPHDQYTRINIYNNSNIYWFSYQADSTNFYKFRDGYPRTGLNLISNTVETLRYEKDSIYSHLGQANSDRRDYWYWGKADFRGGISTSFFKKIIQDSIWNYIYTQKPQAKIKVGLHGLTSINCSNGFTHTARVRFNSYPLGVVQWNGQDATSFEKNFYLSLSNVGGDTVLLNWEDTQELIVESTGEVCNTSGDDVFLINYFELQYWRWNKTYPNYYFFTSPPNDYGENIYWMYNWSRDNMKIYIPSRNELIPNAWITNDTSKSVRFVDTLSASTDYYCVADDYFFLPDSIRHNLSHSDLRNINNAADYIIITHPIFLSAAERLANYRSSNLKGYSSPRVKVVNIMDVYDEFSYGLLNPQALNTFVKYAFDNWQQPAPKYIALLGDLSSDYRKILQTSRDNFIPSMPYHSSVYGQAASDNQIVTIVGNDLVPELAIGRISCETIEEANFLVDRIINYPADNNKDWKQNVLLASSGLTAADEKQKQFNLRNMILANVYIDYEGIKSTKVFRFPDSTQTQYEGGGPEIRRGIDDGAVIVNYYGHGGGFQWDLVFTDDDIRALNNGNKLPVVISVTCYTAHYDNQEIFGEIFNSEPGKGSIAFFGSSGVTFWPTTANFNEDLFEEIFRNKKYVLGDAILLAKSDAGYGTMLALLTLLGDPALELALPYLADFVVKPSSITIDPINPVINDTVIVKIKIDNLGRTFVGDSVKVELFQTLISDSTLLGSRKLSNFGEVDSTLFNWIPEEDGVIKLIAVVNEDNNVDETDHSDNSATQNFSIFSVDKPKILKPVQNYFSNKNTIEFVVVDVGHLVQQNFSYQVVLDTSRTLNSQSNITSPVLVPNRGLVKWSSPQLSSGEYFYQVYIFSESDTNKSDLRTFAISPNSGNGYLSQSKQLFDFKNFNIIFSEQENSLILNTLPLPPRPSPEKLLDSIFVNVPEDSTEITTCTTDGTFLYFGHLSYYRYGNKSKIYKVGTGLNGTTKGMNYGSIVSLEIDIKNQIFYHSDGFIYAATGDDSTLLRITIENGDTTRITIPGKLLPTDDGLLRNGGFYLTSDGQYVYNISAGYGQYRSKYILRILDPSQGWAQVGDDIVFSGSSAYGFSGFFVTDGYVETYESYINGYVRRYSLPDGLFEEEYLPFIGNKQVYSWTYDWENNFLYGGLFVPNNFGYLFGFYKFVGNYKEASGSISSNDIGPARKWKNLFYNLETTGSLGRYTNFLLGKNNITQHWDTLKTNIQTASSIYDINPNQYPYLKIRFNLVDSTLGVSEPLKFKSLQVDYDYFPELNLFPDEVLFNADSLLQGLPVDMSFKVDNIGYTQADSLKLDFYLNNSDTTFFTTFVNVPSDSFFVVNKTLSTANLLTTPVSPIDIKVIATSPIPEYFTFNNLSNGKFYVVRDSANPLFNITFDGREIINGDIISSEPEVIMTLEDNSPLPLTENLFTILHNNSSLKFSSTADSIRFEYTPHPNSRAVVTWTPKLEDGEHTLSIFAKDSSGNPFSTSNSTYKFSVYNNPNLLQVYNYPNPFKDNTHFTFELRGINPPEEFKIKIFTVAGRLIRIIDVPISFLHIGFNTVAWDGLDEDGDEIANGIYFYKIISKHGDEVKTATQKLAKIK